MNKKNYQKPAMQVVTIKGQQLLDSTSGGVTGIAGNTFSSSVSGGSGGARGRGFDDWDDDDE